MKENESFHTEAAIDGETESDGAHSLTRLLRAWGSGDNAALPALVDALYVELRKTARACLSGERVNHSLQATALVHEAYVRLIDIRRVKWQDRAHFLAMAARVMRRILIDHARSHGCAKHGGGLRQVDFDEALSVSATSDASLPRLDDALTALAEIDERKAQVVEMRYFGGLTSREIAVILDVSHQSVNRDWSFAKAWLIRAMSQHSK